MPGEKCIFIRKKKKIPFYFYYSSFVKFVLNIPRDKQSGVLFEEKW